MRLCQPATVRPFNCGFDSNFWTVTYLFIYLFISIKAPCSDYSKKFNAGLNQVRKLRCRNLNRMQFCFFVCILLLVVVVAGDWGSTVALTKLDCWSQPYLKSVFAYYISQWEIYWDYGGFKWFITFHFLRVVFELFTRFTYNYDAFNSNGKRFFSIL